MNTKCTSVLIPAAHARVRAHIEGSIETKTKIMEYLEDALLDAAEMVTSCLQAGGKLLLCGNGGSAADCQHLAAEFVSSLNRSFIRPGLAAVALTTDTSILTASANDFGFEGIFTRQVQALGRPGDVVLGISTSGNSENILGALQYAREHGMRPLGMTGENGGKIGTVCELCLRVPSGVTQHIQEGHIMMGHIICDLVEQSLQYD